MKRYHTSFWVGKEIVEDFKDACLLSGRKTCDVIEPLMKAYVKLVKNKALDKVEACPWKAVEIHIDTLKISQKYEKRVKKDWSRAYDDILVTCPCGGESIHMRGPGVFTCMVCKLGGNNYKYPKEELCKVYAENMWRVR